MVADVHLTEVVDGAVAVRAHEVAILDEVAVAVPLDMVAAAQAVTDLRASEGPTALAVGRASITVTRALERVVLVATCKTCMAAQLDPLSGERDIWPPVRPPGAVPPAQPLVAANIVLRSCGLELGC